MVSDRQYCAEKREKIMKVVDLHCDTLNELRYAKMRGEQLDFANNTLHIDINKMKHWSI